MDQKNILTSSNTAVYPLFQDLENKVVLVTGGAGGIGAEATYAFTSQGARVFAVDIDLTLAPSLIDKCHNQKYIPEFFAADLSELSALDSIVDKILHHSGGVIDVLVNNAGNDKRIDFDDADFPSEYVRAFALNCDSPVLLTRSVLQKTMIPRKQGTVISLSSVHSKMASDCKMLAYGMAKSGLNHFSEWVSRTQGHNGIRSNIIEPGWIATEKQLSQIMTPKAVEECLGNQTVKRIGYCSDIAHAMLYLASKNSGFMNGQTLRIDGGAIGNYNTVQVDFTKIVDPVTKQCLGLPIT